jgi:UDP-hydrolysing UDP-N-acetyl-D-glucosamine 2-epimerase
VANVAKLAVVTSGRQDYAILRSTLLLLQTHPRIESMIWAAGMHLNRRFGWTVDRLAYDGIPVHRHIGFVGEPPEVGADTGRAVQAIAEALATDRPDALMLVGDRSETLAAAVAATISAVPIIHLHGGEETEGAIDNTCRHAITKLSHLHLVSHDVHRRRIVQMGEFADNVHVVGTPAIDNWFRSDLPTRTDLEGRLDIALTDPVVIVILHPTTLGGNARRDVEALASAMARVAATYVIAQPNSDSGGGVIREYWSRWATDRDRVKVMDALDDASYWGLLRMAAAVLGNSSSGILEAPVVGVPAVNVGDRQKGRLRQGPVIDVPARAPEIASALESILVPARPNAIPSLSDAGRNGPAAPRIVRALEAWQLPEQCRKSFCDLEFQVELLR